LEVYKKILGVIATDLKEIINYMYTGRLMINHISILSSLKELGISLEIPQELEHVKNLNFGNEIFLEDPEHAEKLLASLDKFRVFQKFFDCCLKIQVSDFFYNFYDSVETKFRSSFPRSDKFCLLAPAPPE
jgi:hypothetical protein